MNKSERGSLGVDAGIGVFGIFLFALAHSFSAPSLGISYETDARKAQEQAWQHYGSVLTIGGLFRTDLRTSDSHGSLGRDHNPYGFAIWMAGGGLKPGIHCGATDEFGYHATENKVHINDLHATILHQLGLDHEKLTYRYNGRDFRLTDVGCHVIKELLA